MYKLVAIDLDGTLLNGFGLVPDETKQILKKAKDQGIEIVLASGRPVNSIMTFASDLGLDNFLIAGNGSLVYDIQEDKNIFESFFSKKEVLKIAKICEENSIFYNVYTKNEIITENLKYSVLIYEKENLTKPENKKTYINIVKNVYEYVQDMNNEDFMKIIICDESKIIFNNILKTIRDNVDYVKALNPERMSRKYFRHGSSIYSLEYYFSEITKKDADKWYAVQKLADKKGIKTEEIVAIGDNLNDYLMIKNAGLGIAMQNAAQEVKEVADKVVGTNSEQGVKQAFEQYILK